MPKQQGSRTMLKALFTDDCKTLLKLVKEHCDNSILAQHMMIEITDVFFRAKAIQLFTASKKQS